MQYARNVISTLPPLERTQQPPPPAPTAQPQLLSQTLSLSPTPQRLWLAPTPQTLSFEPIAHPPQFTSIPRPQPLLATLQPSLLAPTPLQRAKTTRNPPDETLVWIVYRRIWGELKAIDGNDLHGACFQWRVGSLLTSNMSWRGRNPTEIARLLKFSNKWSL